jgi:hypothetical protein
MKYFPKSLLAKKAKKGVGRRLPEFLVTQFKEPTISISKENWITIITTTTTNVTTTTITTITTY